MAENNLDPDSTWSTTIDDMGSLENLFDSGKRENGLKQDKKQDSEETGKKSSGCKKNRKRGKKQIVKEKIDENEEHYCTVCGGKFIYRNFNEHKASPRHRKAKREEKQKRRGTDTLPMPAEAATFSATFSTNTREKYYIRESIDLSQQVGQYHKILTTFLSLRFCLNTENKEVKISMNNRTWSIFGDIVIELVDQKGRMEIEAIQCKKIQSRNEISTSAVSEDKGKLSLPRQISEIAKFKLKNNYDNVFFKLFTLSKFKGDSNVEIVYDSIVDNWKSEAKKQLWKDKKLVMSLFIRNHPVNTTDDPDNICIFKVLDAEGQIVKDFEEVLRKFSLFMNQRKSLALKHLIRMIIEDKFGGTRDITEALIRFFSGYFSFKPLVKSHYKLAKRDVLLKIAELLLAPYMLMVENTEGNGAATLWNDTLQRFDVVVIKNQPDNVGKIYSCINAILSEKVANVDRTMKTFAVKKNEICDDSLISEIFDCSEEDCKDVTLTYLYTALWKVQLAPLVLVVENEENLALIKKVIDFLHCENLPLKFVLATSKNIHPSYFPEQLKTFTNLEDLRKIDPSFLEHILKSVNIPFLNFSVKLGDVTASNPDFLAKVTSEVLLNMAFEDYAFKNITVPLTEDIIDNTFVVDDRIMSKVRTYFWNEDTGAEVKNLSYIVNIDGCPTRIEVPSDI